MMQAEAQPKPKRAGLLQIVLQITGSGQSTFVIYTCGDADQFRRRVNNGV